jgi:ABC-2 type transport system permease protein
MNTHLNPVPESSPESQGSAPPLMSATRPLYWSVRRELWENRSIYMAPLAASAVYMLGFLISLAWVPHHLRHLASPDPAHPLTLLAMNYAHAGMLLTLTAFLVGIFYSLDALHGERRDRSILFWKSLPVSDLITVLSKASIALAVLPALVFVLTVPLQIAMRMLTTAALLVSGGNVAAEWTLPLFQMQVGLLYGLIVLALWHAPIYCWFLLVSGWARRATFLWAVLPPLAIVAIEYIAFRTSYLGSLLKDRVFGFAEAAFDLTDKNGVPIDAHFIPLTQLAPGRFLSSPGLWLGLAFAVVFLGAAVRLRRDQGPI